MDKAYIIREIKRTAQENGGVALGLRRFESETDIRSCDWLGKFWARWSDALIEAGFEPNALNGPRDEDDLLGSLASFARELGHFPVANEIKLKARTEPGFPWSNSFDRFGRKHALATRLREFCLERGHEDVAALCTAAISRPGKRGSNAGCDTVVESEPGFVYMLKHGSRREYKIGRTSNPLRREGEIDIELPEKLQPIHVIKTDDPAGIEIYWHRRFASKRKEGEWFGLTAQDVRAFKRWKRIY